MVQNVAEYGFDVACVTEPVSVPRSSRWFASANGTAAVFIGSCGIKAKCVTKKIGRNYIVVDFNNFYLFSIYIAPSENNNAFHNTLDLSLVIHTLGGSRIVVTGDFNLKSTFWGSPRSDWRGYALERWAV